MATDTKPKTKRATRKNFFGPMCVSCLRNKKSGDIYPYNENLAKKENDWEHIENPNYKKGKADKDQDMSYLKDICSKEYKQPTLGEITRKDKEIAKLQSILIRAGLDPHTGLLVKSTHSLNDTDTPLEDAIGGTDQGKEMLDELLPEEELVDFGAKEADKSLDQMNRTELDAYIFNTHGIDSSEKRWPNTRILKAIKRFEDGSDDLEEFRETFEGMETQKPELSATQDGLNEDAKDEQPWEMPEGEDKIGGKTTKADLAKIMKIKHGVDITKMQQLNYNKLKSACKQVDAGTMTIEAFVENVPGSVIVPVEENA